MHSSLYSGLLVSILPRSISYTLVPYVRSISSWLKFDANPLNAEWKAVGMNVKPFTWPTIVRKELAASLRALIAIDSKDQGVSRKGLHCCGFVIGSKGSGRSTSVNQLLDHLPVERVSFDFESINHHSFVPFLVEFYTSIFDQLDRIVSSTDQPMSTMFLNQIAEFTFRAVSQIFPEFSSVLTNFIRDVESNKYPSAMASSPKLLAQLRRSGNKEQKDDTAEELFCRLSSIIAGSPGVWPHEKRTRLLPVCLSILISIAEYEENSVAYVLTKRFVQCYPTGERSLQYLLAVISSMSVIVKKPICLVFQNIEILSRSPFLQERGHRFLTRLIDLLIHDPTNPKAPFLSNPKPHSIINLPAFLITDDSILLLRLISLRHQPAIDFLTSHDEASERDAHSPRQRLNSAIEIGVLSPRSSTLEDSLEWCPNKSHRLKVVCVSDWQKELFHQVYFSHVTEDREIANGVYDSVGGKPSYLYRIAKGISQCDATMQKDLYANNLYLVNELCARRDEIVDLRPDATAQEKVDFERRMRQQLYIRSILGHEFPKEILAFQWKMNQFLSLPILERLKIMCQTSVSYYVAVLETIRILLSQEFWSVDRSRITEISHPVILGLLDVKVYTIQLEPTTVLHPYDRLTRNLLHSFIKERFERLSVINQIKYNATFCANRKDLREKVLHMTKPF